VRGRVIAISSALVGTFACLTAGVVEESPPPISPAGSDAALEANAEDAANDAADGDGKDGAEGPRCLPRIDDGGAPATVGGARLRPTAWTSPDGLDVPARIRDTTAGVDCSLVVDTPKRCSADVTPYSGLVFSDSTCKTSVLLGGEGLGNRVVAIDTQTLAWTGDEIIPKPPMYVSAGPGSCTPIGNSGSAVALEIDQHVYPVTKTDQAARVTGPTQRCVDGFLDAIFYQGVDGSDVFSGVLVDARHGVRADKNLEPRLGVAADDAMKERWLPVSHAQNCAAPPAPPLLVFSGPAPPVALWEQVLHMLTPDGTTACGGFPTSQAAYRLGPTVPFTEFEEAPTVDVGGARLRATLRTAGGGPIMPSDLGKTPDVRDVTLGSRCRPEAASDGTTRCLPPDSSFSGIDGPFVITDPFVAYTDAACTTPIALRRTTPGAPAPVFARDLRWPLGSCSNNVYVVGPASTVPAKLYGRITDGATFGKSSLCGACYDVSTFLVGHNFSAFEVTGEADPTAFAPISVVVR
jgi:hypothetical protein